MLKNIIRYLKYWWLMSRNSFISVINTKGALFIFLFGKIMRFTFFFLFLYFLLGGTKSLAGYSLNQTLFFFLTFNLVDVTSQFLFREVYRFRPLVVTGDFDLILTKPINSLFRALMGGADVIDLITIPPLIYAVFYLGKMLNPTTADIFLYILLILNALFIAVSFHIAVLALGILTLEIDYTIMVYRDLSSLGKLPIEVYKEPVKGILTYLVPVGLMVAVPAKVFMGIITVSGILTAFAFSVLAFIAATRFWGYALRRYTSASS
ncbi:ABC-2 family transporter protein [Candidatus Woesebacteria bacterium]|nr:ABC-2 family transporter protein [Candidatus Woesebacteria bacterium]